MTVRRLPLALLCALGALLCLPATPALAGNPCIQTLQDSDGFLWDFQEDGSVATGTDEETYNGFAFLDVDGEDYPSQTDCTSVDDGRGIQYPETSIGGLQVSRRVYVPADGDAYARWYDVLRNDSDEAITVEVGFRGRYESGSEEDPNTSSGDRFFDTADRWLVWRARREEDDIPAASLFDGRSGSDRFDRVDCSPITDNVLRGGPTTCEDEVDVAYENVTVPAGGRTALMHVEHQDIPAEAGVAFAEDVDAGAVDVFRALSESEVRGTRNWGPLDSDQDGVVDINDNCPDNGNADQADLDGDGLGDACDDDLDGDGLENDDEVRLGLDPRKGDTDGDGKSDGVDRCGTQAGPGDDGCPAATVFQGASAPSILRRLRPNRLTAAVKKTRTDEGVKLTTTGRLLLPLGVTPAQGCVNGPIAVQVKSGLRTVSLRSFELRSNCRYTATVTFSDRKRLGRRSLKVTAKFGGNGRLLRRNSSVVNAGRP